MLIWEPARLTSSPPATVTMPHRRPFADAMLGGAQIAAHFQQASRRIPALPLVAVDALGDLDQRAPVHPDIGVVQCLAVPADRRIALFVALDIDFDVVRLHGELDADRAGHVQDRAVFQQGAPRGGHRDLAAGRQGHRAAFHLHRSAAGHLDARLVAPVRHGAKMIERLSRRAIAVCRACRKQQGIALGIQRAPAVGLKQNCRGRIAAQHDLAAGIAGRVEQMHRAARRYRGAGYRDAQLAHVMARQRHVSGRRLDQSVFATSPASLSALRRADTSLPRVVDMLLASDARPLRMMKLSPAASSVWPPGVVI